MQVTETSNVADAQTARPINLTITQDVHDASKSSDTIDFGNGNGDYVAWEVPFAEDSAASDAHSASMTQTVSIGATGGSTITFGGGSGDYVSADVDFNGKLSFLTMSLVNMCQ